MNSPTFASADVLAVADREIATLKRNLERALADGSEGSIRFNEAALREAEAARAAVANMGSAFDRIFGR